MPGVDLQFALPQKEEKGWNSKSISKNGGVQGWQSAPRLGFSALGWSKSRNTEDADDVASFSKWSFSY